jgi:hypothetical protein
MPTKALNHGFGGDPRTLKSSAAEDLVLLLVDSPCLTVASTPGH